VNSDAAFLVKRAGLSIAGGLLREYARGSDGRCRSARFQQGTSGLIHLSPS
jgi:hypothetical protein